MTSAVYLCPCVYIFGSPSLCYLPDFYAHHFSPLAAGNRPAIAVKLYSSSSDKSEKDESDEQADGFTHDSEKQVRDFSTTLPLLALSFSLRCVFFFRTLPFVFICCLPLFF